jgi:hypothetical protein
MSGDVRIVLVGAAKAAHDRMLADVRSDGRTSINSSKLINWIVSDYFAHFFARRKKTLCKEHYNERKGFLAAMKIEDPAARRLALRELARSLVMEENISRKSGIENVDDVDVTKSK